MNKSRGLVVAAVSILLLAGCAAEQPAPIAEPPAVIETPTPTPTPTPEPTKPTLDELVLTPDGLGGVTVGEEPPVVDPERAVIVYVDDYCQNDFDAGYIASPGKWIPNYEPALTKESDEPFSVYTPKDIVKEISIESPEILTTAGVGLGSSLAEVLAAYPDAEFTDNRNTDLYVIAGEHGRLVFEIGAEDQDEYAVNEVVYLRVISLTEELYGWANTDAGFAYCVNA